MTFSLLKPLLVTGLLLLPTRALAFEFGFRNTETILLNDDFENSAGWQLGRQVEIRNGVLTHKTTGSYGRATYHFNQPLNLSTGAINLYWAGNFPDNAHRERDAYWAALQFADNAPICWNSYANEVLATSGGTCPSGYLKVDENGELRTWLRPQAPTTFHRLYVDPGFIPGIDPEGLEAPLTQLRHPDHPTATEQYRLRLGQTQNTTEAVLSFWNGSGWQTLSTRRGNNPLPIENTDWADVEGTLYDPIFTALNFQFRGPGRNGTGTRVDAIALTQELSTTASVPEPSLGIGLVTAGIAATRLKTMPKRRES